MLGWVQDQNNSWVRLAVRHVRVEEPDTNANVDFRVFELHGQRFVYDVNTMRFVVPRFVG